MLKLGEVRMKKKLKEIIYFKTKTADDGCEIWVGGMVNNSPSYMLTETTGVYKRVNIRREIGKDKYKLDANSTQRFTTTCGNERCVHRDHIVPTHTRAKHNKVSRLGRKKGDIANNKRVFKEAVTESSTYKLSLALGIPRGVVRDILQNEAMLPSFYIHIKNYLSEHNHTIADVREHKGSGGRTEFGLSKLAYDFIKSGVDYTFNDFELYERLLDECEIAGSHLVWLGEVKNGTPVSNVLGKVYRSVRSLFMYAVYGAKFTERYVSECGFKDCISPYCTKWGGKR